VTAEAFLRSADRVRLIGPGQFDANTRKIRTRNRPESQPRAGIDWAGGAITDALQPMAPKWRKPCIVS
jgi:hypothetical protein